MFRNKLKNLILFLSFAKLFSQSDTASIYDWNYKRIFPDFIRKVNTETTFVKIKDENIFTLKENSNFKKNGMIYRGFSLSTQNSLSIQSGFQLELSGPINDDLKINAALNDQNLNIPNQSSTQKLKDIDNIFINVTGKNVNSTIGDLTLTKNNLQKKIQGFNFKLMNQNPIANEIGFSIGSAKGKYNSIQIIGIENVQGPYKLIGKNNERNVIIIPGSESVFLDGILLKRGQSNDYIIDYSLSEFTFTYKNIITKNSRITIDFEYNDNSYSTNYYDFSISKNALNDNLKLSAKFEIEKDDNNLLNNDVMNEDLKNDFSKSSTNYIIKSTVFNVGIDTNLNRGKGNYEKRDSISQNQLIYFYYFNPNGINSIYNINFSFLGNNKGSYKRNYAGNYQFVGFGNGDYDTLQLIYAPKSNSILNLKAIYNYDNKNKIQIESNMNTLQNNSFVNKTDNYNQLFYNVVHQNKVKYDDDSINYEFNFNGKYLEKGFTENNRSLEVERERFWGIDSTIKSLIKNEKENLIDFSIYNNLAKINYSFGKMYFGNSSVSTNNKYEANLHYNDLYLLNIRNENIFIDEKYYLINNNWERFDVNALLNYENIKPSINYISENRNIKNINSDSLHYGSFNYKEIKSNLALKLFNNINTIIRFDSRIDYLPKNKKMEKMFLGNNISFETKFNFKNNSNGALILTKREGLNYNYNQKENSYIIHTNYILKSEFVDLNLLQEISTEKTPLKEKLFYLVKKGEGAYQWFDGNNNGGIDYNNENDFRLNRYEGDYNLALISSDKYEFMKSSNIIYRINLNKDLWNKILAGNQNILSANYYFKNEIKNKSKLISKIFSSNLYDENILFLNYLLQQDYNLFENNPKYNFRFRIINKKSKSSLINGNEKNQYDEYNIRIRFNSELRQKHQFNLGNNLYKNISMFDYKNRNQNSKIFSYDYSEMIANEFEYGLNINYQFSDIYLSEFKNEMNQTSQSIRLTKSFDLNSQFRISFMREEIDLNNLSKINTYQIYDITNGKNTGISYSSEIKFETVFFENLNFNFQYNIRKESNKNIYNNLMANIKAFF